MIHIQRAADRYSADNGWLKSNFSFSFADYYDPQNVQFGPLRVLNDDWIAPSAGFGMHPHREMEIVTIVLKGYLEHQDSLGNRAATTWGGIQRMSAGTGVYHSEFNQSAEEPLELLQMWFVPDERGLEPSYETTHFDTSALKGNWVPVASFDSEKGKVANIHQDMTVYLSELTPGETLPFRQQEGRKVFLLVLEGELTINQDAQLQRRDAARIEDRPELLIATDEGTRFMLIDMP